MAPKIWDSFDFSEYDVVVTSASWFVTKGVLKRVRETESKRVKDRERRPIEICYCHTPPRYLYGYATAGDIKRNFITRAYALLINHFMRVYDFEAAQRVGYFIANSHEVQGRIKKFYRRDSIVIYPPVDLGKFSRGPVTTFLPAPSINSGQAVLRVYPERSRRAVGSLSTAATRISQDGLHLMHKTIKKVSEDIENLRYNTAISAIMEWVNFLEEKVNLKFEIENLKLKQQKNGITNAEIENLLLLLAPFAPHMTEELWQIVHSSQFTVHSQKQKTVNREPKAKRTVNWSIHNAPWPKYDPKLATSSKIELVVQVNGKVRDRITVDRGIGKEDAQKLALELKNTQKYLSVKVPQKVIFVKGRLINFVVEV